MEGERGQQRGHTCGHSAHVRKLAQPKDLLRAAAHSGAVLDFGLAQLTQMIQKDYTVLLNITTKGIS